MPSIGDEYDNESEAQSEERLEFGAEDERLPWLEGDEEDNAGSADTGRLVGIGLAGLLAVAAVLGAIWALTRDSVDPDMVADGSTIEAPEGPVKSRPDEAGGRVAEGTGDVAPRQGEGRETDGRIAANDAPRPSIDARRSGEADANAGDETDNVQSGDTSGVGVQVGAFSSRQNAETAWTTLQGRTDILSGVRHSVVPVEVDNGMLYGLRAMAGSASEARSLCNRLQAAGVDCQVKN